MVEVPSFLQIGWLNAIREWQEEFVGNMSSREFVETITRDLLGSCVFVFTPRGEVRLRVNLHLWNLFGKKWWIYILDVQFWILIFDDMVQIKNLPKGATAIDYAYMIHTEIGNKMVAAKVLFFGQYHILLLLEGY